MQTKITFRYCYFGYMGVYHESNVKNCFIWSIIFYHLKDFNIFVLKCSSLLVGLVPFTWLVEGDGMENDSVVLVVGIARVGMDAVDVVFVGDGDGVMSLIHTAPETKWYPVGQVPLDSGRTTIGILVVIVTLLPVPVLLVCFRNCDNGVGDGDAVDVDVDGEYDCCAYTWILLLKVAKTSILATAENIVKINRV